MSDAVKRSIEVVPDGKHVEQVVTDRLTGKVEQTIDDPARTPCPTPRSCSSRSTPASSARCMEGTDGMLRMPGGCFEQTSSSAYPNVLVVDYIKKTRTEPPRSC